MLCMKLHKNNQKRSLRYPKGSKTGQKMLTSKFCFRELQNNIFATHDIQRQERHPTNSYTF